jgi:hypothetical protein
MSARKPPAASPPLTITDRTCDTETGFERRSWKRALVELGVPHAKVGRHIVCRADDWLAALDRRTGAAHPPALTDTEVIELAARKRGAR